MPLPPCQDLVMRCVAGAGLLALVGCNQVFGIAQTREFDASIDVAPDMPHVELTWQIARVLESDTASGKRGEPDPVIVFPPIYPPPRVRIATLDGAFDDDPATYSPSDGWILIPRSYLGITWRLEYTLADGIPHEVQWAPQDKHGRLTVPMFGRPDRDPVPTGGGYTITPAGVTAPYTFPRILTTGLWTEGNAVPPSGADDHAIDYDFASAVSLSGPKGRPGQVRGDRALLVDYVVDSASGCRRAVGAAGFSADMEPGAHTTVSSTWDTAAKPVISSPIDFDFINRLTAGLGNLTGSNFAGFAVVGRGASISMPGLAQSTAAAPASSALLLPAPMMQTLVSCPFAINPLPMVLQPQALAPFPLLLHVQLVETRTVDDTSLSLTSGMETVLPTLANFADLRFDISFPAAIPTQMKLTTPSLGDVDLAGVADHVAIGAPAGVFTLHFTPEAVPNTQSHYYDVLLRRLSGSSALVTERIYTVTSPTVRIDGALLAPATEYVLEIRSFKGHPMAGTGDFIPVDYPYGSAVVFTRTFKTQ
jgi:hypothetical protein